MEYVPAVSLSLLPPFSVADGQEIAHLWRFLHVIRSNPCVELTSPVRGLIKSTGEINPPVRELINPRGNINRPIRGLIIFLSLLLKAARARRLLGDFGTPFFVRSFEIEREGEELCASRAHRFHIRQHLMVFQGAAPLSVEHVQQAEHEFEFGLHFEERQVGIAA